MAMRTFLAQWLTLSPPKILTFPPESPCIRIPFPHFNNSNYKTSLPGATAPHSENSLRTTDTCIPMTVDGDRSRPIKKKTCCPAANVCVSSRCCHEQLHPALSCNSSPLHTRTYVHSNNKQTVGQWDSSERGPAWHFTAHVYCRLTQKNNPDLQSKSQLMKSRLSAHLWS